MPDLYSLSSQDIDFEMSESSQQLSSGSGVTPNRETLCKGYVKKRGVKNSAYKQRFLVLDSESLKWYKNESVFKQNHSSYLGAMDSRSLVLQANKLHHGTDTFTVSGTQLPEMTTRDLTCKVATSEEREAWLSEISHAATLAKASIALDASVKKPVSAALQASGDRKQQRRISIFRQARHEFMSVFESLTGQYYCSSVLSMMMMCFAYSRKSSAQD